MLIELKKLSPICLLNCIYKWVTKVLTLRLEPFTEKFIQKAQSAFMRVEILWTELWPSKKSSMKQKGKNNVVWFLNSTLTRHMTKLIGNFLFTCLRTREFSEKWCNISKAVKGWYCMWWSLVPNWSMDPYPQFCLTLLLIACLEWLNMLWVTF